MEATVFIILQILFATCAVLKIGNIRRYPVLAVLYSVPCGIKTNRVQAKIIDGL